MCCVPFWRMLLSPKSPGECCVSRACFLAFLFPCYDLSTNIFFNFPLRIFRRCSLLFVFVPVFLLPGALLFPVSSRTGFLWKPFVLFALSEKKSARRMFFFLLEIFFGKALGPLGLFFFFFSFVWFGHLSASPPRASQSPLIFFSSPPPLSLRRYGMFLFRNSVCRSPHKVSRPRL